jgi:hypothetical protein
MVMARKSAFNAFTVAPHDSDSPRLAVALLSDCLTAQGSLLSTGLAQLTSGQLAMLKTWLDLQNQLSQQWQAQAADVMRLACAVSGNDTDTDADPWAAAPAAACQSVRRMFEDWGAQWSTLLERGSEQLA